MRLLLRLGMCLLLVACTTVNNTPQEAAPPATQPEASAHPTTASPPVTTAPQPDSPNDREFSEAEWQEVIAIQGSDLGTTRTRVLGFIVAFCSLVEDIGDTTEATDRTTDIFNQNGVSTDAQNLIFTGAQYYCLDTLLANT